MLTKKNSFFLIMLAVYLTAWFIQSQLFINWDVSQLIQSTKRLLEGGTYTRDFFIPNPPMILYLYTPPVLFQQFFHLRIDLIFRAYIFILSSLSLFFCYHLTQTLFAKKDSNLRYGFLIVLASLYLIVPLFLLGQRDCLMMMFTFPYMLMAVNRLQAQH